MHEPFLYHCYLDGTADGRVEVVADHTMAAVVLELAEAGCCSSKAAVDQDFLKTGLSALYSPRSLSNHNVGECDLHTNLFACLSARG